MNSRQIQTNLCYILHSYPYQDNSLILQCFSLERGVFSLLSKGARSSKKQLLSLLQPFKALSISYLGKTDLHILTGVEPFALAGSSGLIKSQKLKGKAIYCAYYINEMLLRLLPLSDAQPEIFSLYQKMLSTLQHNHDSLTDFLPKNLRYFEMQLLVCLGYQPNLTYDIDTGKKIEQHKMYYFDPLSGPSEVKATNENKFMLHKPAFYSGKSLLAIASFNFDDQQVQKDSKQLLRKILKGYLGDKPLNSREVYRQLYGFKK